MTWWFACRAPDLVATFSPGEWTPAAGRIGWDGPAGVATLAVDDGDWRVVATAAVEDGPASLPLAVVPVGDVRWRLQIDDGRRIWETTERITVPAPEIPAFALSGVDRAASAMADGGRWVGYTFGYRWRAEDAVPIVLDGEGRIVWWAPPDPDGGLVMRVKPAALGDSILVLQDFPDGLRRTLHRYTLDGSSRTTTVVPNATHDFWENADGTFTYIAYEWSETETIPGQALPTAADVLLTVPEGATVDTAPTRGFSFFDHFPRDPWYTCSHADWNSFVADAAEWTHTNTILRVEDQWILGVRQLDAVLGVEETERTWQVGGLDATIPAELHHPHLSQAWTDDGGVLHLLVFDNGTHLPAPVTSRVVELAVHEDEAEVVFALDDPEGRYTGFLGDARRLANGNTMVTWTPHGELVEYTPSGEPVWTWTLEGPLGRGEDGAFLNPR